MPVFPGPTRRDIYCHYAKSLISRYVASKDTEATPAKLCTTKGRHVVGILGAGVCGLYTAIMLQSLNIEFEIIEGSERVGGRVLTHKFEKGGEYDYFELGAMRFPLPNKKNGKYGPGIMRRLGELFAYLDMEDKLIPYYFNSIGSPGFQYFNGVRVRIPRKDQVLPDLNAQSLGISERLIEIGVSRIVEDVIGPFADLLYDDLKNNTKSGWETMMENDAYSTRAYMAFKYQPNPQFGVKDQHLSTRVINWCETISTSTGRYDQSLSEVVLGAVAMGESGDGVVDWKCIEGGSRILPEKMAAFLQNKTGNNLKIIMNATVTAIGLESDEPDSPVLVTAGKEKRSYSHVISTIPLPVLRTIDLTESRLDVLQSNALRELQYTPAVKIGVLFNDNWWTTGEDKDGVPLNIVGGQSFTDLPIRKVVYPSQGIHSDKPSKTLIASFCWTNDAARMGALIGTGQEKFEDQLERLVLNNLAELHNVTYEYLKSRFVELRSWDWNHQPLAMGAAAAFGPGNFEDVYTSLCRPAAGGKLHFAGEGLSIHHAWVEGALDSAWRAVHNYLFFTDPSKLDEFFELWGINEEWFEESGRMGQGPGLGGATSSNLLNRYLRVAHIQPQSSA